MSATHRTAASALKTLAVSSDMIVFVCSGVQMWLYRLATDAKGKSERTHATKK